MGRLCLVKFTYPYFFAFCVRDHSTAHGDSSCWLFLTSEVILPILSTGNGGKGKVIDLRA